MDDRKPNFSEKLRNLKKGENEEKEMAYEIPLQQKDPDIFEKTPNIPTMDRKAVNYTEELRIVIKQEQQEMAEVEYVNQLNVAVQKSETALRSDHNLHVVENFPIPEYIDIKPLKTKHKKKIKRGVLHKEDSECNGLQAFERPMCEKLLGETFSLRHHKHVHSDKRPFQCVMCNNGFTRRRDLVSHLIIHTGEKQFKCRICQKEFSRNGNLNSHLAVHSNKKPFKCEICLKKFSSRFNLKSHIVVHDIEKSL